MIVDLRNREEVCCTKCGKPLVMEHDGTDRARFVGCGRDCFDVYDIPDGSGLFGPIGGQLFIYGPPINSAA